MRHCTYIDFQDCFLLIVFPFPPLFLQYFCLFTSGIFSGLCLQFCLLTKCLPRSEGLLLPLQPRISACSLHPQLTMRCYFRSFSPASAPESSRSCKGNQTYQYGQHLTLLRSLTPLTSSDVTELSVIAAGGIV